eukprot:gb/GEZN01017371.1/.p1 GENE.gb/GEZN01017371.1/~~gb/GEZN01017371.1/.p1  ORF type:complete len:166 (+),score=19.57 gb/GEZN01017371.1/:277-774(+)
MITGTWWYQSPSNLCISPDCPSKRSSPATTTSSPPSLSSSSSHSSSSPPPSSFSAHSATTRSYSSSAAYAKVCGSEDRNIISYSYMRGYKYKHDYKGPRHEQKPTKDPESWKLPAPEPPPKPPIFTMISLSRPSNPIKNLADGRVNHKTLQGSATLKVKRHQVHN